MNYEEEQTMEIESLECILMDDLEILSSTPPRQYRVKVLPYANGEGDNHVGVLATFSLPPTYPDVPAEVDIAPEKGLGSTQVATLQALIKSTALENVGMAMVYLLVDVIREWLVENNFAGQDGSMHAEMLKRMQIKEKEKQKATEKEEAKAKAAAGGSLSEEDELQRQKRLEGTPVTPESFVEWRDKFEEEMAAKALAKAGPQKEKIQTGPEKPTGKEMFLRHLAGTAEEDEEEAQVDEEEEARAMEVNAELFGVGDEDDDEDDSDFELDSDEEEDDDDDDDFEEEESSEESEDGGKGGGKGKGKKGGRR